jgi:hypothetical protein
MGPKLVDYLLYEPEDNGILWIKFNRQERMNALVGTSEENGTVAKVGEYMRAGDDYFFCNLWNEATPAKVASTAAACSLATLPPHGRKADSPVNGFV